MAVTVSEFDSEDFYLCQMFGEDSRFVEFTNLTGRYVRLSGRLELENLANMATEWNFADFGTKSSPF